LDEGFLLQDERVRGFRGIFFHRIYTSETRGPPGLENGAFTGIIPFFPVV
jgi:hypothetical protein